MSNRTNVTPLSITDVYATLPLRRQLAIDSAFLASEGGDLLADVADGKLGEAWRDKYEAFIAAKLEEFHDRH